MDHVPPPQALWSLEQAIRSWGRLLWEVEELTDEQRAFLRFHPVKAQKTFSPVTFGISPSWIASVGVGAREGPQKEDILY